MGLFGFKSQDVEDKRRMEAFMDALPFEYCGWSPQKPAMWSRGFPDLFNLTSIQSVRDIQTAILPSDAAALEGMIFTLQKDQEPFTLRVKTADMQRVITLHGMKGQDLDGIESYDVLWAEDSTIAQNNRDDVDERIQKLEKDIHQYRTLLDHLPQSIWVTNDDQKIEWCNEAYEKMVDSQRKNIIGVAEKFNPILTDSYKISVAEMAKNALTTGDADDSTGRVIVNGKRRLMDVYVSPVESENFVVGSAYDITEQEDLRAQLKRYVTANAELLEQLSTAIAIFGADQKLEFYNQSYSGLWGLEDQWLDSQPTLGDILEKLRENRRLPEQANFKDYKNSWLDMFTALMDQHQSMMYLPDGVAVRLMVAPHPMGGLMMTFEDVTSRLELESSYNTLIAVQRETLDNLGEGVAVFGSDARLQLYNPSYLTLWGLNPEDVEVNPHITKLVERKKRFFKGKKASWDGIQSRLISHAIDRNDVREKIIRSDDVILECSAVSLPDGGVMVTYRDITDSSRVQDALEEKNQALIDAEKLKTDFLANVSYQLRTPLNAISGFAEILNNEYFGEINDKQREYTQGINDATDRLASLINDILDLSSIEAGYLRLDKNPVVISEMMDSVYDLTRDWAGMETLKIKLTKPKKPIGTLIVDETRLKQAIINIIRNAINYTPGGGRIDLILDGDDDKTIAIIIKDSGIGIADEQKEKIFEPFHSTKQGEEGTPAPSTGLGLSLAHNIIVMHGGSIDVNSVLGEGTTVIIRLPK
jgi:PAS domain S-box-containing protein